MASLIYIADPMCSWCYGFGPELSSLAEGLPGLPIDIVVGGLRAYNTQVMDEALKATLLSHWERVEEVTGLPFNRKGLSRDGFIYDTEPACRAVVTVRTLAPSALLPAFHAFQHAFYEEGQDITNPHVLADIGSQILTQAGFPIDASGFLQIWAKDSVITLTHNDFMQTQRWGITGFPALVLERNGQLDLVASGFTKMPVLVEIMQALVDRDAATNSLPQ